MSPHTITAIQFNQIRLRANAWVACFPAWANNLMEFLLPFVSSQVVLDAAAPPRVRRGIQKSICAVSKQTWTGRMFNSIQQDPQTITAKMIPQKKRLRGKKKINIVEKRARGLFHSVKLEMETRTHPSHLFIEVRERFNVTPLPERSVGTRIRISNE